MSDNPDRPKPPDLGSPGSHLSNWRPGDDDADELLTQKITDALRDGASERQIAKLLGVSRMVLWRGQLRSTIPETLYDRLLAARVGTKALDYIARLCRDGEPPRPEIEFCPNCGYKLRIRSRKDISRALDIMEQWGREQAAPEDLRPSDELDRPRDQGAKR
jgi:hypothetical protein